MHLYGQAQVLSVVLLSLMKNQPPIGLAAALVVM
jgi:hypothetical protein